MNTYTKFQNFALLAMRVIVAATFLVAAYGKLPFWSGSMGFPAGMTYLMMFLSIIEPLGAIALLGGFLTRWASIGLSIIMVGAIFVTKFMMNTGFMTSTGAGWSFPLALLGGCIVLAAFGAGRFSIDGKRGKA